MLSCRGLTLIADTDADAPYAAGTGPLSVANAEYHFGAGCDPNVLDHWATSPWWPGYDCIKTEMRAKVYYPPGFRMGHTLDHAFTWEFRFYLLWALGPWPRNFHYG
jgi:hypothetical protein